MKDLLALQKHVENRITHYEEEAKAYSIETVENSRCQGSLNELYILRTWLKAKLQPKPEK